MKIGVIKLTSLSRKQRRQQERQQQKLAKKLGKISDKVLDRFNDCEVDTSENQGLPTLSDFISDFAEPLYDSSWNEDGIDDIYVLVCCCWNIGTCSEEYQEMLWAILIDTLLCENFDDPNGILANKLKDIIAVRRSEFTKDRRFVIDFFLEFTADNCMNLKITSAPMAQEDFVAIQAVKFLSEANESVET